MSYFVFNFCFNDRIRSIALYFEGYLAVKCVLVYGSFKGGIILNIKKVSWWQWLLKPINIEYRSQRQTNAIILSESWTKLTDESPLVGNATGETILFSEARTLNQEKCKLRALYTSSLLHNANTLLENLWYFRFS